jgi:hypothetical protein
MSKRKSDALGISFGTANSRLTKMILFDLVNRLNLNICYRCSIKINDIENFSIDHKEPWRNSINPIEKFFDIYSNIAFSHKSCNSLHGARMQKIKKNAHGFRGVIIDKRRNLYRAQVRNGSKKIRSGYCFTIEQAAKEYNKIAIQIFGSKAILNKINV